MWPISLSESRRDPPRKQFFGSSHRICDPTETLRRIGPNVERFGITRVANVTGLDWLGVPTVMVVRPNSRSLAVSQGKGLTLDAAKVSGLMEAIELYHAEHIDKPLRLASWEEMSASRRVVDIRRLPPSRRRAVDTRERILWIEGFDLIADAAMWVPLEVVSVDSVGAELPGAAAFRADSNGLASGNDMIEAACHALCELIERDAATLWRASGDLARGNSRIDLATVDCPQAQELLQRFAGAQMDVMVWDATSDLGAPVFICMLAEASAAAQRARYGSVGMGCHPAKDVALLRALTEAAQSRLTLIAGARDDVFRDEYDWNHFQESDVRRHQALAPEVGPWRQFTDLPQFQAETVDEDLDWLVRRLKACGLESLVAVDLTLPEFEISVVRLVAPGLEGHDNSDDYQPGERARRLASLAP